MGSGLTERLRGALALVFVALLVACGAAPEPESSGPAAASDPAQPVDQAVTVYLVRHAEKQSGSNPDPDLTAEGRARADALADLLAGRGIDEVVASQFLRTQQTVQPLAERLGLTVEVVDAAEGEVLAERLRSAPGGRRVVVAGHSNTVPALIGLLGVEETVEIPDDRYGDLFVVRILDGAATLERERFGG